VKAILLVLVVIVVMVVVNLITGKPAAAPAKS
jgi:hypothetical protein